MTGKRWQKSQRTIAHIGLMLGLCLPLTFLQANLAAPYKLLLAAGALLATALLIRTLHRRYSNTFVKVFECEYDVAASITQRLLNSRLIHYTKQTFRSEVAFYLRKDNVSLIIESFPLNLPYDDHLKPKIATKITIRPETAENASLIQDLRQWLDEAICAVSRPHLSSASSNITL